MVFTGIALIWVGVATQHPFYTAVGGSVFGVSLGSLVGRFSHKDLIDNIHQTLRESLKEGLTSDEAMIAPFRVKWHVYHVTQMDNNFVWRHSIVDFSRSYVAGKLVCEVEIIAKGNRMLRYNMEAAVHGGRLVMLNKTSGDEMTSVFVFPFAGWQFDDPHYGFMLFRHLTGRIL